jgi:hypothetical protein
MTALAGIALGAVPAPAADLAKVERRVAREPAYQSRPRYCLLVFSPEAKTRVWLVLDGHTLYVDRNGNGDLTEAGEKVTAGKGSAAADEGILSFEAGDIREGKRTHKNLAVVVRKLDHLADLDEQVKEFLAQNPEGRGYSVGVEMEMPGWKGAGVGGRVEQLASLLDVNGVLQFADKPQDAPVIHFGGPWQVTLCGRHRLTVGREADLFLRVGTPGLGAGTTADIGYEGVIPGNAYPTAEITYPPRREGETPVQQSYELKGRC